MKAIIVSEAAFTVIRDHLVAEIVQGMKDREARIKSGDVTGMTVSPEPMVNNRVHRAFEQMRDA